MAELSQKTLERLNKFKQSDKFNSLAPETQARFDKLLGGTATETPKTSMSAEDSKMSQNPLMRALIGLNKGMSDIPVLNQFVSPEFNEFSNNAPAAEGMVNKVAEAAGQATPTIIAATPFVKGGQVITQGAKFIPQALKGIAGASAGFGAYEGTKAAVKGEKDKIIPAAIGGAASGALLGAGGQVGSNIMSKFAPGLKYGANIGTGAGQAATAAAMAPEGERGTQAIVAGGLGLMNPIQANKGKTAEEKLASYADKYRKVLAPGKDDIKKVEILSNKNLDDYYKLAAKEGLIIKSTSDNKLNTEEARAKLETKTKPLNEEINTIISANKAKQFSLDDVKVKSQKLLRKTFKNDLDYKKSLKLLDEEIAAAQDEHGDIIDGVTLNTIKQGMWAKGYDQLNPNSKPTAREIGNVAKNMIEDAYPTADIKNLNKKLGDYYTLDALLETAHGRVVQKGKLGRYVSQGIGAAVGAPIPYIGPFAGGYAGGKLHDFATSPESITGRLAKKVSKLGIKDENVSVRKGVATPEILNESPNFAMNEEPIKALPSPNFAMNEEPIKALPSPNFAMNEEPIKALPSPLNNPVLKKGEVAKGEGFTVTGGTLRKGGIKSSGYELRTSPDAEPMHVYVDKDGRHFVYEGSKTNPSKKFLGNDISEAIYKQSEQSATNEPLSQFNPLNKQGEGMKGAKALGLGAGIVAGGMLLSPASAQAGQTIGMKNNNPINLKAFQSWDGMSGKDKYGHAQFKTLDHGIRAAVKNLKTHQRKNPSQSLKDYLSTFAEANSQKEAEFIAKSLGVSPKASLASLNMEDVLIPLARFESKTTITKADIARVKKKFNLR